MPLIFISSVSNGISIQKETQPIEFPTIYHICPDAETAARLKENEREDVVTMEQVSDEASAAFATMQQVVGLLRKSERFLELGDDLRIEMERFPQVLETIPKEPFSIDTFNPLEEYPPEILVVTAQGKRVTIKMYNKLKWVGTPSGLPKISLLQAGGSMYSSWVFRDATESMGFIGSGRQSNPPVSIIFKTSLNGSPPISPRAIRALDNYLCVGTSQTGR